MRMMLRSSLVLLGLAALTAQAAEVTLYQLTLPERRTVKVPFAASAQAPRAEMEAELTFREGQAEIEIRYDDMKPAVLFGGDVTSYVLWAVARDGAVENLGELKVRDANDKLSFASGLKSFGLLVTAEAYPRVAGPSELVMFTSGAPTKERYPADPFTFARFLPSPQVGNRSLSAIGWDRGSALDVVQAERIVEMAEREGSGERTADLWREMQVTLGQARNFATKSSRERSATDYAGRTVALASESLQIIRRQKESEALERQIAARKAEMAALEERASAAEREASAALAQASQAQSQAQMAEAQAAAAQAQMAEAQAQSAAAAAAVTAAQQELARLDAEKLALQATVAEEMARAERLKAEKEEISSRLQGALSQVADTQASARGLIVNLPDILFDTNEATIKTGAREVIAKLSGILLIMPELNLRIEGHTDSTGSRDYNQRLSEKRAVSVRDYLASQGISATRMIAVGYGWDRPVADNTTTGGRSKNRRVEIVIGEGVIQEAPPQ